MSKNTEEIWKEVVLKGFGEGGIRYQVSNSGNINLLMVMYLDLNCVRF